MNQRQLGKVFVTGSDGFIGSHLVDRLLSQGLEVTALCVYNSLGSWGWLNSYKKQCPSNLRVVLGDVRDPYMMNECVKGHETVFHLASLIAIPYSYEAPGSYIETNVKGSLHLAQACLNANVGRMIHTSTSEVYGTALRVPIDEEHPLQGQSPYSASKISADMTVSSFHTSFNLPVTTLRPFNTFGPRQSLRAVIPTIINQIHQNQLEIKLGSLTPTRDFNFVTDTVDAFLALASHPSEEVLGSTFNAGSGREISIHDLVHLIGRLMGKEVSTETESIRLRPEKSEVQRLLADASKLRNLTGWAPRFSLEDGLKHTIDWLVSHSEYSENTGYQV